jgi:gamma-glutamyltranspeptidase/glutathione hydrolase
VKRLAAFAALLSIAATIHGSHVVAGKAALSTASPLATRVGLHVLQRGGNAIDAAVAVAFALAVVHPQAGNLGGGGFLVYYDASSRGVWTLDFSEVAPYSATRDMYVKTPAASRTGALAAGVPGTVAGLDAMHQRFGSRPWKELLAPAILLARQGFPLDATLTADLDAAKRDRNIEAFRQDGALPSTLVQSDLGSALQRLADSGARDFYRGDLAKKLIEGTRNGGGVLGYRDLREYKPLWRAPIKLRYGDYDLYTVAPPSGGGVVIGEALNILGNDDLAALGFQSTKSLHLIVEAQRRAYIDRNRYVGDPASTRIPYRELLSLERGQAWRKTIDPQRVVGTGALTEPALSRAEGEQTTHFTIADAEGNIAAVTTSLGENFGSGFIVPGLGFFLNNTMDDFMTVPNAPNRDGLVQNIQNSVEPGRRATSSMSPVIVLHSGKPMMALGTRGGPSIPTTILQVFLNLVVYGKSLPEAIAAPRYHHQAVPESLFYERHLAPEATIHALNALGHGVTARDSIGDVHAILFDKGRIIAVADPRGGGSAGGY